MEEDPDLLEAGAREAFLYLVSLEDGAEKVSSETLDLIESLAPRLSADPRVVILRLAASREQTRRGDAKAARASALAGLKGLPEDSPFSADLYGALASAERAAKKPEAAVAAARKAVALGEKSGGGAWARVSRQFALAETLAFAGQNAEARKTLDAALGPASNDPGLLARASTLLLVLKDVPGALANARRAVEISQGGDAKAQAALGEALAASGDADGRGFGVRARRRARARERRASAGASTPSARRRAPRPPEKGRPRPRSVRRPSGPRGSVGSAALRRHRDRPPRLSRDEDEERRRREEPHEEDDRGERVEPAPLLPPRVRLREEVDERRQPFAQRHHLRRDHLVRRERRRRDDRQEPEREPLLDLRERLDPVEEQDEEEGQRRHRVGREVEDVEEGPVDRSSRVARRGLRQDGPRRPREEAERPRVAPRGGGGAPCGAPSPA